MKLTQFKQVLREVVKDAVKDALNEFLNETVEPETVKEVQTTSMKVEETQNRVPKSPMEMLLEETRKGLTQEEVREFSFTSGDAIGGFTPTVAAPTTAAKPTPVKPGVEAMIPGLDMSSLARTVQKATELQKERRSAL